MKKLFIFILTSFLLLSCGTQNSPQNPETSENKIEKTKITTSILPLTSLVNTIGGEKVEVKNIVGAGKSPHNFDLKSSDLVNIEQAKGIVMIGMEHIDGFLDKNIKDKNVLRVSDGIKFLEMGEHDHDHEDEENSDEENETSPQPSPTGERVEHRDSEINSGGHFSEGHHDEHKEHKNEHHKKEHKHDIHKSDPHIWNGVKNITIIAKKIENFLAELSPENKEIFEKNYSEFIVKVDNLVKDFHTKTDGKKQNYFIVFHDAYNYFFADLGIDGDKKLVFRKSVLNEPNSKYMQKLLDEIQLHNVKVAFIEPQFKNSNFEKIAKKYEITTYILDPLGNDESANGYLQNLENNLESLEEIFE